MEATASSFSIYYLRLPFTMQSGLRAVNSADGRNHKLSYVSNIGRLSQISSSIKQLSLQAAWIGNVFQRCDVPNRIMELNSSTVLILQLRQYQFLKISWFHFLMKDHLTVWKPSSYTLHSWSGAIHIWDNHLQQIPTS